MKQILSLLPISIKLHLISWIGDNLSDEIDLYI